MTQIEPGHPGPTTVRPTLCIRLGSGRRLALDHYVAVWKGVRNAAERDVPHLPLDLEHPFDDRNVQPTTIVLAQFRRGMHDRINRHIPHYRRGRKWDTNWQAGAERLATFVNRDHRRAFHPIEWRWVPRELRRALRSRQAAYG